MAERTKYRYKFSILLRQNIEPIKPGFGPCQDYLITVDCDHFEKESFHMGFLNLWIDYPEEATYMPKVNWWSYNLADIVTYSYQEYWRPTE